MAILITTKTNDALNRLLSISSAFSASSVVSYSYLYNTANQRIRATLADGSYWVYQYDSLGQVTSGQKYWQDETAVGGMQFGYAFDDIGNRQTATTNGRQADYTANLLNEYTEATVPGAFDVLGTANPAATLTINRAAVPNRTGSYYWKTLTVNNAAAPVWQEVKVVGVRKNAGPDAKDVVTESIGHEFVPQTPEAFTYDDDGNLLSDGRWAYTWDGENRLVKMEAASGLPDGARKKIEFVYDGQSRRIEKKSYTWSGSAWVLAGDLVFVYDGWNLIAELNANDLSLVRKYAWGLDLSGSLQGAGGVGGLLAVTSTTATQFTAYDGNGNVVALIDATTGAEAARYEYDPFGNTLVQTGATASANPFRFSTKYTDDETGLLYYGLRYYSPGLGRWTSRDPIGEDGGANVLVADSNDCVNAYDPLGLAQKHISMMGGRGWDDPFYLDDWRRFADSLGSEGRGQDADSPDVFVVHSRMLRATAEAVRNAPGGYVFLMAHGIPVYHDSLPDEQRPSIPTQAGRVTAPDGVERTRGQLIQDLFGQVQRKVRDREPRQFAEAQAQYRLDLRRWRRGRVRLGPEPTAPTLQPHVVSIADFSVRLRLIDGDFLPTQLSADGKSVYYASCYGGVNRLNRLEPQNVLSLHDKQYKLQWAEGSGMIEAKVRELVRGCRVKVIP